MKFREKPAIIDAIKYTGKNKREIYEFTNSTAVVELWKDSIQIPTLEGVMTAKIDDWIIKGIWGEFYPVKDDIFKETYELI